MRVLPDGILKALMLDAEAAVVRECRKCRRFDVLRESFREAPRRKGQGEAAEYLCRSCRTILSTTQRLHLEHVELRDVRNACFQAWDAAADESQVRQDELWEEYEGARGAVLAKRRELRQLKKAKRVDSESG